VISNNQAPWIAEQILQNLIEFLVDQAFQTTS
jgi:hypothetical protein